MSRLLDETLQNEIGRKAPDAPRKILRSRRRRALHPGTIQDMLRERAARDRVTASPTPFGWLVIIYTKSGRRPIRRATKATASYQDAVALCREEMEWLDGDVDTAYVVRKVRPDQKTLR